MSSVTEKKYRGHPQSEESKRKIALSKLGEKNVNWAGDNLKTLRGLHKRISRTLVKPAVCVACKEAPPRDLANVSSTYDASTYNLDLSNWRWLCRGCHMKEDGRMAKIAAFSPPKKYRLCDICPSPHHARGYCKTHYYRLFLCSLRRDV